MHIILNNPSVTSDLFGIRLEKDFEIYNESSVLRDYWYKLGKPKRISNRTCINQLNERRERYLIKLCEILKLDINELKRQHCYYSVNHEGETKYINSPSNYKDREITYKLSKELRALFNMRQDLLIINGDSLYFFEAKMEAGNDRAQIHRFTLLKRLLDDRGGWAGIPDFSDIKQVKLLYIKRSRKPLNVQKSDSDAIEVFCWDDIFRVMREELGDNSGISIDEISSNILSKSVGK